MLVCQRRAVVLCVHSITFIDDTSIVVRVSVASKKVMWVCRYRILKIKWYTLKGDIQHVPCRRFVQTIATTVKGALLAIAAEKVIWVYLYCIHMCKLYSLKVDIQHVSCRRVVQTVATMVRVLFWPSPRRLYGLSYIDTHVV